MISPLSTNRSLTVSTVLVVASSTIIGIFLNRMGWHGAWQQYPAAMYALMVGGGAAFVVMCVAISRPKEKKQQGYIQQAEEFLAKPRQRQENLFEPLTVSTPLFKSLFEIVLDYALSPLERRFLQLKMGVPLSTKDPEYVAIRNVLIHYKKFFGGNIDASLDPCPLKMAFERLCCMACIWKDKLSDPSQPECTLFGHMCVLVLHSQRDDELIDLRNMQGTMYFTFAIKVIINANRFDAATHVLSHIQPRSFNTFNSRIFENLFDADIPNEEMGLLMFEIFLKVWEKQIRNISKFFINPYLIIYKGWTQLLKKIFEVRDLNDIFQYDLGTSFWQTLFQGASLEREKDYVQVAIVLLQNQIRFPNICPGCDDKKPKDIVAEKGLTEFQKLLKLLDEISKKTFVGILNDQELLTFNERIKQEGFV